MLEKIQSKISAGERISKSDIIDLFNSYDIFTLGKLASQKAEEINGKRAFFVINRHINPTNICINRCKFCAFSRSKGEEGAYELTIEEILKKIHDANTNIENSIREVHIVGGLHPDWDINHYIKILSSIKREFPSIAIKAFTAVEIDHIARKSGLGIEETLLLLKKNGLDIMPAGGAEIFSKSTREQLCPEKISGERWLEIMEVAHTVGIKSNASMLYGHIETFEDRAEHLIKLRNLQDRTSGFQAFISLPYHPKNTQMGGYYSSGIDDLKTIAISRLALDNFAHIKAYWVMLGEKISQVALLFGADDIDGTIIEERITHSAGAVSGQSMKREELINLIRKANRVPVERDAFYNIIEEII
ncbi:MAG: aminofutalosine synthase MqnE [Thermodesulfovibrionales bacterium]|nr:aminofutalosine synthase MqnE [Thermodesulfovibrionales bacterium]